MDNYRPEFSDLSIENAINSVKTWIKMRLQQKGRGVFVSSHEILGILTEEFQELKEAVRSNVYDKIQVELLDIAVGCILGIE